jgi:dihydrofolate synthase / folylpolyglutamate synthase
VTAIDPIEFLFSLERLGMKFGLENISRLCAALDHPERRFRSVIVAGTNGKGSVAAMVETGLRAAGHHTARYTSPHLVRLEERFAIDGGDVDTPRLRAAAARVQAAAERLVASGALEALPTFFECTTAVAFQLFADASVDPAVLEVGLGGRLDATNVVSPMAAAIVSIDFDHQAQLGDTLASIAFEKAGVVKPGIPVVCGAMPSEALDVIERVCAERGATLIRADREVRVNARVREDGTRLDVTTPHYTLVDVPMALAGAHQAANAAVALRLLETLDALGLTAGEDALRAALSDTVWPARLERLTYAGCRVTLDAAHNPAGARALARYLATTAPDGVTLVFGAMKDKDARAMLAALAPHVHGLVCTTAPTPRALDAAALARIAASVGVAATVEPDPLQAFERACRGNRHVVVAGSIFLAGPIRDRVARGILR